MIDLYGFRMKRDIEILISDIESSRVGAGQMMINVHWAAANELITRIRKAEKDAARYRWLREQPCSGWEIYGEETSHIDVTMWRNDGFDNCNNGESLFGESMDAAIDEAMQCNK